jgi:RHS repeat-associated protein
VLTDKLGNGLGTTRGYDELDRMTSNVVEPYGGGTDVQNFTYTYDTIGNLAQRVDVIQSSLTENFAYDRLNRLLQSSGTGFTTQTIAFNAVGNITSKSNVGTYNYNAQGTPCTTGAGGGPHALCSVTGTVNGYANPTFSYDANGSLTTGLGRTLTYTSFNMPATVTAPNNLVPGTSVTYTYVYNADHERVKHIIDRTNGTFTTIYLHPAGGGALLYEKEIKPTLTEHKHYIVAGSILVGVYLSRSDSTTETRYFHSDRLGSLTLITNASGAVIERLAYEAYGTRRYPAGTDDTSNALYGITTDRGFTGHEHLDEIALIHMNGRVYDPLLGRFFTADPIIQDPNNLQSYNRYTYGINNPLAGVDPSGYFFGIDDFFIAVAVIAAARATNIIDTSTAKSLLGIATAALVGPGGQWGAWAGGTFGTSLAGGFVGGLVSGGSLESGLQGSLSAALFFGAGELGGGPLLHAGAGCISAAASGGDCGAGALSAGLAEISGGLTKDWSPQAQLAASVVVGGTGSVIGGGKFANGAVTGAFGYLFNCGAHDCWNKANQQQTPLSVPTGVGVDVNIAAAEAAKQQGEGPNWFYDQVRNKGPWDYKQAGGQFENFGNFNYGATGAAFGFSEDTLLRMAGWASVQGGTSSPQFGVAPNLLQAYRGVGGVPPFGDHPVDQYWIRQGIQYYKQKAGR